MRRCVIVVGLAALLSALPACNQTHWNLFNKRDDNTPVAGTPQSVEDLVKYLNDNSSRLQNVRAQDIGLEVRKGILPPVTLRGTMVCEQPRNFRLAATFMEHSELDLGSNQEEFWFWIKRGAPYQFHCSYRAAEEGRVQKLPLPIRPDWIMEVLGMANFGPASRYERVVKPQTIELVERTRSPQGTPVTKIMVIRRRRSVAPTPQVTDFLLLDGRTNKEICSAHVERVEVVGSMMGVLPRDVVIHYPDENVKMAFHMAHVEPNIQLPANFTAFMRQPLRGIPSVDLATGQIDGQPSGLQRTRLN
jgi:hypothetical protein